MLNQISFLVEYLQQFMMTYVVEEGKFTIKDMDSSSLTFLRNGTVVFEFYSSDFNTFEKFVCNIPPTKQIPEHELIRISTELKRQLSLYLYEGRIYFCAEALQWLLFFEHMFTYLAYYKERDKLDTPRI